MKKLLNDPRAVVRERLEGLADTHPGLALLDTEDVVVRADLPPPGLRQVAIISGGGAGHEPAHAGYVGGVVLVVKNDTGDRLNFGLAAELARAAGIPAEVVVADDVARRRAIAGSSGPIDAFGLLPAAAAFTTASGQGVMLAEAWAACVAAAEAGADATARMTPRLGRASDLGARAIGHQDGGAVAVAIRLRALTGSIR